MNREKKFRTSWCNIKTHTCRKKNGNRWPRLILGILNRTEKKNDERSAHMLCCMNNGNKNNSGREFCARFSFNFVSSKKSMVLFALHCRKNHLIETHVKFHLKKVSKIKKRRFHHMKIHVLHHFFLLWSALFMISCVTCWTCVRFSYIELISSSVYILWSAKVNALTTSHDIWKFDLITLKCICCYFEYKVLQAKWRYTVCCTW